jgi:predicted RND superfamily exporter protein
MMAEFRPGPPDLGKVPASLRGHLVSESGVYALYIYPKEDLWKQAALERFVGEIESRLDGLPASVTLTGIAHNIAHSTAAIRSSFVWATVYALGLIVVLVWIDMRRLSHTLAAISVLALGLPMLVGLMGLCKVEWNFANFFGLPILIGAGHEYGVFLIHRYREALAHPRRGWIGWDVADKALLLCAFVTSSSFGFFFLLAHHRGLKSLGLVMALGSACIYLASVVAVRPILKMRLGRVGRR